MKQLKLAYTGGKYLVVDGYAARLDAKTQNQNRITTSPSQNNAHRALFLAQEGRFCDAMQSLSSQGCASDDDVKVLNGLMMSLLLSASLAHLFWTFLKCFPRVSSLRIQSWVRQAPITAPA